MEDLPLRPDSSGEAVADLQRRLLAAGVDVGLDEPSVYGPGTAAAVCAFQERRGITVDGVCGLQTWQELVEASWRLGDRNLYLRRPMQRGDDVEDLQRRLAALGFHRERVDGIFGPDTQAAVLDFQHNTGLTADGILGSVGVDALERLGTRTATKGVTELAERIRIENRTRALPRLALTHAGNLDALVSSIDRQYRVRGVPSVTLRHPDSSWRADAANRFGAELTLDFATCEGSRTTLEVFQSRSGERSSAGRSLALHLRACLSGVIDSQPEIVGRRHPILRETSMPAVLIRIAPIATLVPRTGAAARAIVIALEQWANEPLDA